jgi:fermentation-respiration switch protein FrsA (DUF1100 family)
MDFREHGVSDQRRFRAGITLGIREAEDIAVTVEYARKKLGYGFVVVMGTSQGGSATIVAAASKPGAIDCVIAENPFASRAELIEGVFDIWFGKHSRLHLNSLRTALRSKTKDVIEWFLTSSGSDQPCYVTDAIDAISKLSPTPVLIMHPKTDPTISYHQSERLYEACNAPKQLWLCAEGLHTGVFDRYPDEFEDRSVRFALFHDQSSSRSLSTT